MKVSLNGEIYEYDGKKAPMSEALWIEATYQRRYVEWQLDLQAGSARAMAMLACLIWRREGRDVPYADVLDGKVDFDLMEMLNSMVETDEAEADPQTPGTE